MEDNKSKAVEILTGVTERIKSQNDWVKKALEDKLVQQELDLRVSVLEKLLTKRSEAQGAIKKVDKADQITYNADGSPAAQTYSKERLEEIKKAKKALDDVDNAIDKALNDADWQKAKEIANR